MKPRSRNTNEKKSQGKDLHVVSYDLRGTVTVSDDPDDPVPEILGSIQIDFWANRDAIRQSGLIGV